IRSVRQVGTGSEYAIGVELRQLRVSAGAAAHRDPQGQGSVATTASGEIDPYQPPLPAVQLVDVVVGDLLAERNGFGVPVQAELGLEVVELGHAALRQADHVARQSEPVDSTVAIPDLACLLGVVLPVELADLSPRYGLELGSGEKRGDVQVGPCLPFDAALVGTLQFLSDVAL